MRYIVTSPKGMACIMDLTPAERDEYRELGYKVEPVEIVQEPQSDASDNEMAV